MKKILSSELGFFLVITTLLMSISLAPTIKRFVTTPSDRVFSGLEYYSDDYSIYVSNILQGQRGRWTLLDKHTTEPHQGTIVHDEYLLWGKLMGLFGIDQIKAYHLARITFGVILLGMIYLLLKQIFPAYNSATGGERRGAPGGGPLWETPGAGARQDPSPLKRKLAFFLIAFSTGFPIFVKPEIPNAITLFGQQIKIHMEWLTEMDVFYRFLSLPHYLLGNIFFVGSLICFLKYLKNNHGIILRAQREVLDLRSRTINQYLVFGSLCSLMLSLIHPVALVSLMALLAIYLWLSFMIKLVSSLNKLSIIFSRETIYFMITLISSLPIILYYRYLMSIPPWNHMAAWEGVTQYFVPAEEFALAIGPTFFLGIIGFFAMLYNVVIPSEARNLTQNKSGEKDPSAQFIPSEVEGLGMTRKSVVLLSWILSFFLLVYFSYPILAISQVRFMQVFIFIPFGILATEAIFFLRRLLTTKYPSTRLGTGQILLLLLIFLPIYYFSFLSKWYAYDNFSELSYPFKKINDGYQWLYKNTNPNEAVLTAFLAGTQIPYLSGNTVFTGHLWATLNRLEKEQERDKFLKNQMAPNEVQNFFIKYNLKYFFDDYQASSYGIKPSRYLFLTPVFQNEMVTIYQFQ